MAWERRGQRWYYYSAERRGGKVVKTYLGRGETADLIGQCVAGRRLERQAERLTTTQDVQLAVLAGIDEVDVIGAALARSALLLAGYRRHKRGEWRRPRPLRARKGSKGARSA